jgi:hypothetical protein
MAAKKAKVEACVETPYPESWYMSETVEDQKAENRREPNEPCSDAVLAKLGIHYWKLDAGKYEYPTKAVPWDPSDAADPELIAIRDDRGYSYAGMFNA